ncbi:MAG: sel1 repeat family protein [Mesorhizobium sp.]|nr:MAG: sel1 repeat family protein [Mesorhizobium sp.]
MSNNDWTPEADTTVFSPPARRRRTVLPVVLVLLAAFVLLGPARNYYVQWSAIRKAQAAFLAKDYSEQFRQTALLAKMGHADAQSGLGAMYWHGQGIAQNAKLAAFWWGKAAEQGNADAASWLSQAYSHMWTAPTCKCFLQTFLIGSLASICAAFVCGRT